MKIRQLIIFKTVCEEESITKAAETLSMTQPSISRTISELEEDLGTKLFDRVSRKVYLNETGKLLLSKTVPLLELYDDLEENSKNLDRLAALRIGSSMTIANYILPSIMKTFKLECANTPTSVLVDDDKNIENRLLHHEIDLALMEGVITNEQLEKIPFSTYPLSVLCSPSHPFASRDFITVDELSSEPLLLREKGSAIRDMIDSAFLLKNISVTPSWTSVNPQVLLQAVKQELGITILPRITGEKELEHGTLAEVHVEDLQLDCVNHVVFLKDKFQTVAFQTLINLIIF